MTQTLPFNLESRVIAALTDSKSELWFPHLTYDLAQTEWRKLEENGINASNYGTARVVLKDVTAERIIGNADFIYKDFGEIKNEIFVEILPSIFNENYKESGVYFYTREELHLNTEITDCLRDAFEIIRYIPNLFASVRYLVKSIHLIKPEEDDYDVSFSEPHIPFSIFVSVPQKNISLNALRVAEAIIHEAMHLQLTLIENVIELIKPGGELYYSPWREEYRSSHGIIHGLYVFCVINQFFKASLNLVKSKKSLKHIETRLLKVGQELKYTESFQYCSNLTNIGIKFVNKLLLINR